MCKTIRHVGLSPLGGQQTTLNTSIIVLQLFLTGY